MLPLRLIARYCWKAFWHWGDNMAYKAYTISYPADRIGVVWFTNSENGHSVLGATLAASVGGRHPAVSWLDSFTDYAARAAEWWSREVSPDWALRRQQALGLLTDADELERIVNLVGPEALSSSQRWVLESAGLIKEAVLQQSALDDIDSYCSPQKQFRLLNLMLRYHHGGVELIGLGVPVESLTDLPFGAELRRLKSAVANDELDKLDALADRIRQAFDSMRAEYSVGRGEKNE